MEERRAIRQAVAVVKVVMVVVAAPEVEVEVEVEVEEDAAAGAGAGAGAAEDGGRAEGPCTCNRWERSGSGIPRQSWFQRDKEAL
jgi:hypothetical protein